MKILYVTTNLFGQNVYGGYIPFPSDHRLEQTQRELITYLNLILGVSLTVSLHDVRGYRLPPWYLRRKDYPGFHKVKFVKDRKLSKLVRQHDAIVIDWPSTTLLEVLGSKKPIFVLESLKIIDEAKELLTKRVVLVPDTLSLIQQVRKLVEKNEYDVFINDDSFLKTYWR